MSVSDDNTVTLQDLLDRGEWQRALAALDEQMQHEPDNRQWPFLHASLLIKQGQVEAGIRGLEQLTRHHPDYLSAWVNLGQAYKATSQHWVALQAYRRALSLDGAQPLALRGAAQCAQALAQLEQGAAYWQRLSAQLPDDGSVWLGLAQCQLERKPEQAIAAASKALALEKPGDDTGEALPLLARAHVNNGAFEAALPLFQRMASEDASRRDGLHGLLACLLYQGHSEDALEGLDAFREAGGQATDADMLEGKAHLQRGDIAGAVAAYRRVLAREPFHARALHGLLAADGNAARHTDVAALEQAWADMSARDRMMSAFVLARWYENQKNRAQQLHWLNRANALQDEFRPCDLRVIKATHQVSRQVCTAAWVAQQSPNATLHDAMPTPLLICGMPRSGTTLVEQMLAALPDVTPCGENRAHLQAAYRLADTLGSDTLKAFYQRLDAASVQTFRAHYRDYLASEDGVASRWFTSKAMDLGLKLGLLLAACPEARVVHMRRHPLDVGLGCYKQYFAQGQEFSNTWAGIALYYAEFERIMAHWATIFPEAIMVMPYEQLVTEPEASTRRLAAHCGLSGAEAMLDFQQSSASVTTASASQVRQGLFTSAVGRWRDYGTLLEPLKEALEAQGVDWREYQASS